MEYLEPILVIAGTVLPLIGTGLTVLLAIFTAGIFRWFILGFVPALTLVSCWLIIDLVWNDGNLLAAALYMVYMVALFIYYPILTIVGIYSYRKHCNQSGTEKRIQ